jgi:hypothetical protein
MIDPAKINDAMQSAPLDGKDYRLARAAIRAVLLALVDQNINWAEGLDEAKRKEAADMAAAELVAAALE